LDRDEEESGLSPTVLHVAQPTVAGVPVVVRGLAQDQVRRGWQVFVACPGVGHLPGWVTSVGARHVAWEASRSPGLRAGGETRALQAIVGSTQPDLVHLHSSRGARTTIFQPHGWSFLAVSGPMRKAALTWERYGARWAHAIAHVSPGERLIAEGAGIKGPWAHTPNGVDVEQFRPEDHGEARRRLEMPDGPIVLCVGRLCRQKGQDWLLNAWPQVLQRVPEARLVLVGARETGFDLPRCESVRSVGEVSAPADWYAAADVVVIPSRWEGAPLVAREAMACGRSVVLSRAAGLHEDLPEGAGAVVAFGDTGSLVARLTERLLDQPAAEREGFIGRSHAIAHFDLRASTQTMAQLYGTINDAFRDAPG
jgi:glycosyltransferase involved in cell wall biosynthesis